MSRTYISPMNRREFTASLAALAAAPAIPVAAAPVATAKAALPPGAYLWAELIARAQNTCSPAMIAKHLRISTTAAEGLFNQMVQDGVLRAPGLTGAAQAAKPLQATGTERSAARKVTGKLADWMQDDAAQDSEPLVNPRDAGLGCGEDSASKDIIHASPDQPAEESPQSG